jgi:TetR/AcrR family transcriptional regulator, mexJK operon transcriptional repressor
MAKELSERQAAKREQIALAARKLFLSSGYSGTSMDAVTAEAGVSKQTLYAYFPTKLDLLTTTISDELGRLTLEPTENFRVTGLADLRALMVAFSVSLTDRMMTPDTISLLRLLLAEAFRVPELRQLVRDALPGQLLARTERLLAQAEAAGLISVHELNLSARMFIGPLMSYVILDGVIGDTDSPPPDRKVLEYLVDAFLKTVEL